MNDRSLVFQISGHGTCTVSKTTNDTAFGVSSSLFTNRIVESGVVLRLLPRSKTLRAPASWTAVAVTPLSEASSSPFATRTVESGVALRFPPHSKTLRVHFVLVSTDQHLIAFRHVS